MAKMNFDKKKKAVKKNKPQNPFMHAAPQQTPPHEGSGHHSTTHHVSEHGHHIVSSHFIPHNAPNAMDRFAGPEMGA